MNSTLRFNPLLKNRLPNLSILTFSLLFGLIIIGKGLQEVGRHPMDEFSENVLLMQGNELIKGNHKYGITYDRTTHYCF